MFAISSEFKKYAHLLLDLHFAMVEQDKDEQDKDESGKICDLIDIYCSKMTALEKDAISLLSYDLHDQESILKGWLKYEDIFDVTREQTSVINIEKQKEENDA